MLTVFQVSLVFGVLGFFVYVCVIFACLFVCFIVTQVMD